MLPGEREPGVAGKLPEEGPLRSPVALAEWMQGVDLAQVIGQPPDERCHAAGRAGSLHRAAHGRYPAAEEILYPAARSVLAPLAMATRPDLPGPLINITENPLMDLLQVRQVIAGGYKRVVQQDQGRVGDLPLGRLKYGGGAEPELVVQDSGDRVTVRVLWHSRLPVARDRPAVQLGRADLPVHVCRDLPVMIRAERARQLRLHGLRRSEGGVQPGTLPRQRRASYRS